MKWRKWNNILHRDIGYLTVGLTIIFAISGIAVNHIADWNPNYKIEQSTFDIGPITAVSEEDMVRDVLQKLNIDAEKFKSFRPSPQKLQIFLDNQNIELNIQNGRGRSEVIKERALLHDFNFLHLNHPKKIWTYVSDIYALALLFLAISGMFVLKGKKGIKGRGAWLVSIGVLIPIFFLWLYKYL